MASKGEETFALHLRASKLPVPKREYTFSIERKWRFDFAWPMSSVAVEIEGGTWSAGRHTRGLGFAKDCEKYNYAQQRGWIVGRFTTEMVERGDAIEWVKKALG